MESLDGKVNIIDMDAVHGRGERVAATEAWLGAKCNESRIQRTPEQTTNYAAQLVFDSIRTSLESGAVQVHCYEHDQQVIDQVKAMLGSKAALVDFRFDGPPMPKQTKQAL